MKPERRLGLLSWIVAAAALCRCMLPMSGGGTEDGNATKLRGRITDATGKGAPGARVLLLRPDYDPAAAQPVPESHKTVTDASGCYLLTVSGQAAETYNIEARNGADGTKGLVTGIETAAGDSVFVPECVLAPTGTIRLYLPDTLHISDMYIFAPGTTVFENCSTAVKMPDESYVLYLDDLPAAVPLSLVRGGGGGLAQPFTITDNVTVPPDDTTMAGAFHFFRHYREETSGLPSNLVNDIFFDRNGNKWFATNAGVARLRGELWTVYKTAPSELPGRVAYCIAADNADLLWFGTDNGAASLNGSTWTTYNPDNLSLKFHEVFRIACGLDGTMWFGGKFGIAKRRGMSWQYYDADSSGLPSDSIADLIVDRWNRIWCATGNGVARYEGGVWFPWTIGGGNPAKCRRILMDRNDRVWIGDSSGTVLRSDGINEQSYGDSASPLLSGCVNKLYEDFDGAVWVCTDAGLTKFDGTSWFDCTGGKYAFLQGLKIFDIAIDSDRSVWLATNNGVIAFGRPVNQ